MFVYIGGGFIGERALGNSNMECIYVNIIYEKTLEHFNTYGYLTNKAPTIRVKQMYIYIYIYIYTQSL